MPLKRLINILFALLITVGAYAQHPNVTKLLSHPLVQALDKTPKEYADTLAKYGVIDKGLFYEGVNDNTYYVPSVPMFGNEGPEGKIHMVRWAYFDGANRVWVPDTITKPGMDLPLGIQWGITWGDLPDFGANDTAITTTDKNYKYKSLWVQKFISDTIANPHIKEYVITWQFSTREFKAGEEIPDNEPYFLKELSIGVKEWDTIYFDKSKAVTKVINPSNWSLEYPRIEK